MVLGYDLTTSHFTGINDDLISSKKLVLPDVVLVRKIYSKDDFDEEDENEMEETNNQSTTTKKRMFTLQTMEVDGIGVEDDNEMIVGEALMVDEDEMGGDEEENKSSTSQRRKKKKKKTKRKEFQMSRKQMEVWSFQIYFLSLSYNHHDTCN